MLLLLERCSNQSDVRGAHNITHVEASLVGCV